MAMEVGIGYGEVHAPARSKEGGVLRYRRVGATRPCRQVLFPST